MTPDDLIITSKLSERLICREKTEVLVQDDTFFAIDTTSQGPYVNGPTHNRTIYKGRAKCSAHEVY